MLIARHLSRVFSNYQLARAFQLKIWKATHSFWNGVEGLGGCCGGGEGALFQQLTGFSQFFKLWGVGGGVGHVIHLILLTTNKKIHNAHRLCNTCAALQSNSIMLKHEFTNNCNFIFNEEFLKDLK